MCVTLKPSSARETVLGQGAAVGASLHDTPTPHMWDLVVSSVEASVQHLSELVEFEDDSCVWGLTFIANKGIIKNV